jgi:DNA-binding PadR family transcriptional regulator
MFDSGELRLVLLKLIGDQPRHGYDLIREIEALSGGAYVPSAGVIYPTLTLLADMGHVDEAKGDGARKLFAITADGAAHLAEKAGEVEALLGRLAELSARREKTESGPVRRAMMNLRQVLQQRLTAEEVSPDTLHEVAAILDAAAQKIERL